VLCLAQQQRPSVAPEMTRRNTSQSVTDAADNATISARSPAQLVVLIDNPAGFKDDLAESVTSPIEVTIRRPSRRRRARCTTKSIACPIMSAAMSPVCVRDARYMRNRLSAFGRLRVDGAHCAVVALGHGAQHGDDLGAAFHFAEDHLRRAHQTEAS
jgi:hypothetical protein